MNAFKMSVQKSVVHADEFNRQNESTNANVKDDLCRLADDSDQAKSTTEDSDSSSTKQTKLFEPKHIRKIIQIRLPFPCLNRMNQT